MRGRTHYFDMVGNLFEAGSYDFETADLQERYILTGDNFSRTKTDSFLDWVYQNNLDIDEILTNVIEKGAFLDYGKNIRHPESKIIALIYKDSALSDETIYCKMSIEESKNLLHIDIHRSFSDDGAY